MNGFPGPLPQGTSSGSGPDRSVWTPGRLTEREFNEFAALIHERCGIHLAPIKLIMLSSRLSRRLRALGMNSYGEYLEYVRSRTGDSEELTQMIDVVTTNKTEFFREARHFGILTGTVLPELARNRHTRLVRVWSAGCSTGEEPYTLAMLLEDWCGANGCSWEMLASDISTRVLAQARRGVYAEKAIEPVPDDMKHRYLLRGKGNMAGKVRVIPGLRNRIDFKRINFVDEAGFGLETKFDVIFCRNVVIYFNRETQKKLFERFYRQLVPGGYLFIGMSETLHRINDSFVSQSGSVYRKPDNEKGG